MSESNTQLEDTLSADAGALSLDADNKGPQLDFFEQPRDDEIDYDAEDGDTSDWFGSDEIEPEAERVLVVGEPEIRRRLTTFLKSKPSLATFFSGDLKAEAEKATAMANKLITEEKCPDKEVARELSLLSMYDLVLLIGTP